LGKNSIEITEGGRQKTKTRKAKAKAKTENRQLTTGN
jgi:hypothetical protein